MLKLATIEDFDQIFAMAMKFASSAYFSKYVDEEKMKDIVQEFLTADNESKIVILHDGGGMIAGYTYPFIFGQEKVASDIAWWVEPEARGAKVGKELLDAFEFWAKKINCKLITMVCLDESLGKYYEKRGYALYEHAYMKELS